MEDDERGVVDETNLDLNVEPLGSLSNELEEMYYSNILRGRNRIEEVSLRPPRNRWRRWRPGRTSPENEMRNISLEMIMNPSSGSEGGGLQVGEGSVVPDERIVDSGKNGKRKAVDLVAMALEEEIEVEKESSDEMSFYDCNICFDMASDPVVTSCGHLFCWSCLYQWLHVHSTAKACPVCQGEVVDANITPIYGRGGNTQEPEKAIGLSIPPRPQARRAESLRQTIHRAVSSSFPIEEMIQRIGRRFDVEGEAIPPHNVRLRARDYRSNLNAIFNSRGSRREAAAARDPHLEQSLFGAQEEIIDLTHDNVATSEAEGSESIPSGPFLRTRSQRTASLTRLSSALSSAERLVQAYFIGNPIRRSQTNSVPVEDRDSVSSIAAVIQSESPTVDTAAELDSLLSISSPDTTRASYVESGVSRTPRRRRRN